MAKTLLELFETKTLSSGKTAEKKYDISDSKDVTITSGRNSGLSVANPLITYTGMRQKQMAIEIVKQNSLIDTRTTETFLEQEATGNQIVRLGSLPIIYGSELPRILLKSTPTLDKMRDATSGPISETNENRNGVDNVRSTLGLSTPIIPTYVVNKLKTNEYKNSITQNRINDLSKIKSEAEGIPPNFLGIDINLSQLGGGTPTQMAKSAIAGGIRFSKSSANEPINNQAKAGSDENLRQANQVQLTPRSKTPFEYRSAQWYGVYDSNYGSKEQNGDSISPETAVRSDNQRISFIDNEGLTYSSTILPGNDNDQFGINTLAQKQKISTPELNAARNNAGNVTRNLLYSKSPKRFRKFDGIDPIDIDGSEVISNDTQNKYGFYSNRDQLMLSKFDIFGSSDLGDNNKEYEDFILLKFKSIEKDTTVQFRSTITSLNETFSPTWDSAQFLGSPFDYHTYSKISRAVSFSFTVYSMSVKEHKNMWKRLNFLTSLVYPQGYYESSAVKPPLLEFTLGSMYENKPSFITQLSYTVDDNAEWEIGNQKNLGNSDGVGYNNNGSVEYVDVDEYKLPRSVGVQIGLTILESRGITENRQFYSFNPVTN